MFGPLTTLLARAARALARKPLDRDRDALPALYPIWNTIHQPDSEVDGFLENTLPPYVIGAKPGVLLKGVDKEVMTPVLTHALSIVESMDKRLVITSGVDGTHMRGSLHYSGRALDIRTRHLQPAQRITLKHRLKEALGRNYDVVLEKTHLHVEYDPA